MLKNNTGISQEIFGTEKNKLSPKGNGLFEVFGIKRSQVWVETVIYTLIGLTLIAIVLSVATPQINKVKDRSIVEQTFTALSELNNEINRVSEVNGNIRIIGLKISKGKLDIDSLNDKIIFSLENTDLKLSEPNNPSEVNPIIVKKGDLYLRTDKYGSKYNIYLELDYGSKYDITQDGINQIKTLYAAGVPHNIKIENIGDNKIGEKIHLDISFV